MAYALGGPDRAPAVVLQSGLGDGRATWSTVWPQLTARYRVFALDRPGYGDSPATAAPRDPCQVARELHAALQEAKVPPPYLLVGHSLGGLYQFVFARLYPDETAGMLLLDPTHPEHGATLQRETPKTAAMVAGLRNTLFTPTMRAEFDAQAQCLDTLPPWTSKAPAALLFSGRFGPLDNADYQHTLLQLRADWQQRLGASADTVSDSGHYLHREAPHRVVQALEGLLSAVDTPPDAGPLAATPAEQLVQRVRQHRVCGAAMALVRHRELDSVATASGCDSAQQVRRDSVFQAASLSKPLFAYAVLKLVHQRRLALDAPVLQYLPRGYRHAFDPLHPGQAGQSDEVRDARLAAVTVRMLLQHTAGLPNWASGPLHFEGTPGEHWSYSGEGYVLLQRAVEAVMQRPLDELMQELVLEPLGMARSSYRWTPQIGEHLLPGTKANGAPRAGVPLRHPVAAFSLYTTVDDYARFVVALLRDPGMLGLITDSPVEVDSSLNLGWGLGWGMEWSADGVHLWQWGNNPGYRAFVLLVPGSGDGLILLTSSDAGLKLVAPLLQAALPAEHKVLRSPFLSMGVLDTLCEILRVCL